MDIWKTKKYVERRIREIKWAKWESLMHIYYLYNMNGNKRRNDISDAIEFEMFTLDRSRDLDK